MLTREEEIGLAYGAWVTSHPVGADHGDSFIAGAQWADKNPENKWRDAAYVQPQDENEVLVVTMFVIGQRMYFEHEIAYYNKSKGLWFTLDGESINVTHWQPLPELPKDDE
jgi:hypothetical protein